MHATPAQTIRQYLDEQGGRAEASVEDLITTWQLDEWSEDERILVTVALASAGVKTEPLLSEANRDTPLTLSVAKSPVAATPPWGRPGRPETPPAVAGRPPGGVPRPALSYSNANEPDTLGSQASDSRGQQGSNPSSPAVRGGGLSGWIARRPLLALWLTLALALIVGIGIGAAAGTDSQLQEELDQAREESGIAQDETDEAIAELEDAEDALRDEQARSRRLERRVERVQQSVAPPTPEPAQEEQGGAVASDGSSGDTTVGDLTFSDVQVRDDGIGDFEVRTRVTNNGEAADLVSLEATLFSEGTVVASLQAIEDFDAGQTRTVTFIGTDPFGPWDDIEFTVDEGF